MRALAGLLALLLAAPLAAQPAPAGDVAALARDVERVESLRAIKDLQRLYAQYAQYGLWSEIGALFAPEAPFTFDGQVRQGQTMTGPDEIAGFLRARYGGGHEGLEPGDTRLMMIEQPVIRLAANGREATGRWAVLIFLGGKGKAAIEGGIFVNDYRQGDDGKWRIAGARYFPQYSGPYETGWTNWGGGDLPIVPYHFTPDEAGVPIMAPEGEAPATQATLAQLSARIRTLNDEDTVRNLQAALGFYLDRKMWDDVVDMLDDEGVAQIGDTVYRGKAGLREWLATMGPAGLAHGQLNDRPQFDTTVWVAPDGNEAWVRGIELGQLGEADQEKGWWEAAAFRNRYVREGGVWKLRELRRYPLFRADYDLGWGMDLSAHPEVAQMPAFLAPHPVTGQRIAAVAGTQLVADGPLVRGLERQRPSAFTLDQARTALQRSLAYDATENVSSAYGDYLDDFQSDNFSALLARDGFKMSAFAGYYVGRDRVAEAGRRVWGPAPEMRSGISFHWRVQPVILVSDDGRSANQRVRLFQPRTGKTVGEPRGFYGAYFYSGMYHDQYVLEDGVWRMWNLSLDEPYMGTVDWKSGWQRAKDPTTPPQGATSVLVREDSDFKPDVPVKQLGRRQEHFRGGTGEAWQWPTILPMWFEYRNPVSGRVPEFYQEDCPPCTVRPDLRLDRHGYQQPPVWPQGASSPTSAASTFTIDGARIDRTLQAMVDAGRIAGAEVLIWKDGHEVHYGTAGLRRIERPAPFARDTAVQIYSMTKPVTGVALMQLWEQGKFGLDDPLERHLPQFAQLQVWDEAEPDKLRPPSRKVTIRDVLRHTAGFTYGNANHPSDAVWNELLPLSPDHTLAEFAELMPRVPLLYDPGTHWSYSAGVDVQARLVEVFSGQPFDEYVRDHIFTPLGMTHSCWKCGDEVLDTLASIYALGADGKLRAMPDQEWLSRNFADKPMTEGGAGIVSTIDDYMRFARMLLGEGQLDGVRILQPATVRLMATDQLDPRIAEADRAWLPSKGSGGFGLDFFVRTRPPQSATENRGEVGEFFWDGRASTLFWVDPRNAMAVVFLTQKIEFDGTLHHDLRDAIYGADYAGH
ncbi:MAG: serine hydrolase [Novosphingobium sp.]|nr:serine hydrolase [Novosphingobium sp.]